MKRVPGSKVSTKLEQHIDLMMRVKSNVWEIENEWRLTKYSDTEMKIYKCPISPASIKTIILGFKVADETVRRFSAESAEHFPEIDLFRAKKRHGKIALDFEKILRST